MELRASVKTNSRGLPAETGWLLIILVGLGFGIPIVIVDWTTFSGTYQNVFLAWLITFAAAARIGFVVSRPRVAILELGIYLFIYVFAGITPLAQTATGVFPLDSRHYDPGAQTRQLIVLLTGFVAFEVGLRLLNYVGGTLQEQRPPRQFSPQGVAVLGLIGLVATSQQVATHGISAFFVSRSETARILAGQYSNAPIYTATDKAGIAIQTVIVQFSVFVALFGILYSRRHSAWRSSGASEPFWRLMIVALIVANVIVNNPIGNSRLWGVLVIFGISSIYWDVGKPRNGRIFLLTSLIVLLLLFPLLDYFRFTDANRQVEFNPQVSLVENGSYPVFQMALNGGEYVDRMGHTGGRQIASAVLAFVPRSAWPSKAGPTGQVVDPHYLRSASAWTEAYVDFGLGGVALLFTGLGVAVRYLSSSWQRARPGAFHAVMPLAAVYAFFILRGSLLPAVATLYQLAGFFVVAIAFGGRAWVPRGEREEDAVVGKHTEGVSPSSPDPSSDPKTLGLGTDSPWV